MIVCPCLFLHFCLLFAWVESASYSRVLQVTLARFCCYQCTKMGGNTKFRGVEKENFLFFTTYAFAFFFFFSFNAVYTQAQWLGSSSSFEAFELNQYWLSYIATPNKKQNLSLFYFMWSRSLLKRGGFLDLKIFLSEYNIATYTFCNSCNTCTCFLFTFISTISQWYYEHMNLSTKDTWWTLYIKSTLLFGIKEYGT